MSDSSKILGLVTTNAMVYDGNVPSYSNGFLTYNVAGMHYEPDGTLALGSYDMIMADSVARCLYGFTNAPISASISVTENGTVENIATTSVSDSGGWLRLSADGFTFSDPVITARLTQKSASKKIVTITCRKGKASRKVRGVTPRCPNGYKKT